MKMILPIVLVLGASSAFAADFECSKKVSATRFEGAYVSTQPQLLVFTIFRACTSSDETDDGGRQCTDVTTTIANPVYVCNTNVDVRQDCSINETATSLDVVCNNGTAMNFTMDTSSIGKMTCSKNGIVRGAWDVGKDVERAKSFLVSAKSRFTSSAFATLP